MEIIIGLLILAVAIFLTNQKKGKTSDSGAAPPKKNQPAPKNKEEFVLPLDDGDGIDEVILDEKDL